MLLVTLPCEDICNDSGVVVVEEVASLCDRLETTRRFDRLRVLLANALESASSLRLLYRSNSPLRFLLEDSCMKSTAFDFVELLVIL